MTTDQDPTHLTDDDLVLHYYGELPSSEEAAAAEHVRSCARCRTNYARLQRTLGLVNSVAHEAEPAPGFERIVWARLEPRLRRRDSGWLGIVSAAGSVLRTDWLPSRAALALAAAVLVLVAGAFFAGRSFRPADPGPGESAAHRTAADSLQERILLLALGDHLERSQMVLVELASTGADDDIDLTGKRARAEQLVADSRLYRISAAETGEIELGELLDEIERVLTDIAANPERMSADELAGLQRRIEARDLLFKLRIVSSELGKRQKDAIRQRAAQTS